MVELVQEPLSGQTGLTFYFQVNGIPVFAKVPRPSPYRWGGLAGDVVRRR